MAGVNSPWRRRDILRCGAVTVGTLGGLRKARASESSAAADAPASGFGKAKAVILICLLGGPPQQETWDPKPDAPADVRGEFRPIPTTVSGFDVCELMPRTALQADRIAALRAMVTGDNAHSSSGYYMLTGVPHIPQNQESVTARFPNRHPNLGAVVRYQRGASRGIPAAVQLPMNVFNCGNIPWPGQDAGWLGQQYDPWLVKCQPEQEDFRVPELSLPEDVVQMRFDRRRVLREQIDGQWRSLATSQKFTKFESESHTAYELLASEQARIAFDIGRETPQVRDRYGRTAFGQSLLLARRLVEAGSTLVQVNWTRTEGRDNIGMWDTHIKHNRSVKEWLMPIMDQGYSALLADLAETGRLDETLVVWMGEFGRTPRFNGNGGRDHWGHCFSAALAGGGVRGGQVIGRSDAQAAFPEAGIVRPEDLSASILHGLGISPEFELHDPLGRPLPASRGRVVPGLFA